MGEPLKVTGMVLMSAPSGEYDRRAVILTKERGKITAFVHGARRPNSPLAAAAAPFIFGIFTVYEGRSAYTLVQADITEYFREVRENLTLSCYACYFMEVAQYYTRENLDGSQMLNLLYATLRALPKREPDNELILCIFEMKAMLLDGVYPYETASDPAISESVRYAIAYVIQAPIGSLYRFTLSREAFAEFRSVQDRFNRRFLDREFHSLAVLRQMTGTEKERTEFSATNSGGRPF